MSVQKGSAALITGLPTKDGIEKPIFDYQELLYEALLLSDFCNPLNHEFKDKHLWIKKARGLGASTGTDSIHRLGHSDTFACHNCKVTGDRWFMEKHCCSMSRRRKGKK